MLLAMRLTAGILTYNDQKYLARCLETLVSQQGLGELSRDWRIVILDNGSKDIEYLLEVKRKYPLIDFLLEKENHGFSKGHNIIMRRFPAEFHAVLNNDVLFSPEYLSLLTDQLEVNPNFGSATGKLLWWAFGKDPERTMIIDSTGLGVTKSHRFFDRGQGEIDRGQYDQHRECFGASGAAALYRRTALEEVSYKGRHTERGPEDRVEVPVLSEVEVFDETMFMYKEDCDLAERLVAVQKPCLYVPTALAWHNRTASTNITRAQRSQRERTGSTAHHTLIIRKHWRWFPWNIRMRILLREFFRWTFILVREPTIFFGARKVLWSKKDEIQKRRMQTKHSVSFFEMRHLFS